MIYYALPGDDTTYGRWISHPDPLPSTLWVEWGFRSNHPIVAWSYTCDAYLGVAYHGIVELTFMYGDAAVNFSGDFAVLGLDIAEFHTYRFETLDGHHYRVSVDGILFADLFQPANGASQAIQMAARGGCSNDWIPDNLNEWDFVRYGTISFGERIVSSEPAMGFLDPGSPPNLALDRFTVTYDSLAYAYIDDITVAVTCDAGPPCVPAPQVIATKRLDNGPPDVLEVVLDRSLAPGERTTFTFTDVDPSDPDHPTINTVAYTFQRGDVNADGRWDLRDFASLQNCYFTLAMTSTCAAFDYDVSIFVDAEDYAAFALDFVDHGP